VLTDGKKHSVDSNDFAITSAGKLSVKAALSKAGTCLLQPMEEVHFQVSEKLVGEITSIVSRNDGYVMGSESTGVDSVEIEAILPSASIPAVSDACAPRQLVREPSILILTNKQSRKLLMEAPIVMNNLRCL